MNASSRFVCRRRWKVVTGIQAQALKADVLFMDNVGGRERSRAPEP